jgi:hypothetical protein
MGLVKRVFQPRSEPETCGTRSRGANRSIVTLGRQTRVRYQRVEAGVLTRGLLTKPNSRVPNLRVRVRISAWGQNSDFLQSHAGRVPQLHHNRFLPYPFQFVVHQPSYYATLKPSATPRVAKYHGFFSRACSSTSSLKMEAECSTETSVTTHQTTRCYPRRPQYECGGK